MSKQATADRVDAIIKAAERLSAATVELHEASKRVKEARAEHKSAIEGVTQAESADYENLYTQEPE